MHRLESDAQARALCWWRRNRKFLCPRSLLFFLCRRKAACGELIGGLKKRSGSTHLRVLEPTNGRGVLFFGWERAPGRRKQVRSPLPRERRAHCYPRSTFCPPREFPRSGSGTSIARDAKAALLTVERSTRRFQGTVSRALCSCLTNTISCSTKNI